MPEIYEKKLKKEYGAKSDIPYKIMNKQGYMKGNKETSKGKAMEKALEHKKGKKHLKHEKNESREEEKEEHKK